MSESQHRNHFLLIGGLSAVFASLCCLGPLLLLLLGFSGAWLANLTAFEPYRPFLSSFRWLHCFLPGNAFFERRPAVGAANPAPCHRFVGGMPLFSVVC